MNLPIVQSVHSSHKDSQRIILTHYIFHTLPLVKKELHRWKKTALNCTDPLLQIQALSSIETKDFHCYGGAVFAISGNHQENLLIQLIVAYQTICDYLDNLCDRNACLDGDAFRQLHIALQDALQPGVARSDYYHDYPNQNDGGYLAQLVDECHRCIRQLHSYPAVQPEVLKLVQYYIDLQVNKHIDWTQREKSLIAWAENHLKNYPDIYWQEFAAASGSTLAVFALFALATRSLVKPEQVQAVTDGYFPWICGLHILLDYFIDREEDRQGGDLNFTFYYDDEEMTLNRLKQFIRQSHNHLNHIENPIFAKTVTEGLLALYLSDDKISSQGYKKMARQLIDESGPNTWHVYRLCSLVRKFF